METSIIRSMGSLVLLALALGCGGEEFTADAAADAGASAGGGSTGGASPVPRAGAGGVGVAGGSQMGGGSGNGGADSPPEAGGAGGEENGAGAGGESPEPPSECPCAAPKPACVAGKCVARGPALVKAGPIYVDSTEVTGAQYDAFLADKRDDTSGQAPECAWNDSFAPDGQRRPPSHPVTSVDFCDAAAFCAWSGKRLCGKLGGGELQLNEIPDASKSEWFSACGGSKGQPYPYGTAHVAGACNDATGSGAVAAVASFPGCSGAYPGIHDMVGNVSEWIDACDAAVNGWDGCETIGGTFADQLPCTGSGLRHRDQKEATLGFRCCAD